MGWPEGGLKGKYGNDVFDELKKYMKKYGIVNPVSIKMFLATLRHESGGGTVNLEYLEKNGEVKEGVRYTANVRGAGLIQITAADQRNFLQYIYDNLPSDDPRRGLIKPYIDGFTQDGWDNLYAPGGKSVAEYISQNYPVESAAWYWGGQVKISYTDENGERKKESLNDFAAGHAGDNQYNTFAVTQMAVNGNEYSGEALNRFAENETNCEIREETDESCEEDHSTDTCFKVEEDQPAQDGTTSRHSYGPRGWQSREEGYNMAEDYFEKLKIKKEE